MLNAGMRLVAKLPLASRLLIGRVMGRQLQRVQRRQRRIANANLALCFPELDAAGRRRLLRRHFESLGMSLTEMATAWFASNNEIRELVTIDGREHLEKALREKRGVLLVTAHFTMLELGVAALENLDARVTCLYRPQRNALMDAMILDGRRRFSRSHIPRDNVRALIRRLRANDVVLYLPDQTHIGNQSALLPFFGEPAMTNTAAPKLARLSGATMLTYFFRREPDNSGYRITIGPPLPAQPDDDAVEGTRRLFARLEAFIRQAPDQYLWVYKKFKRRPPSLTDPYAD